MPQDRTDDLWSLVPPAIRELPADLAVVIGVVGSVNFAVFLPVIKDTPLRIVVGLPFVLFVPGYAFIAALFPEDGESPPTEDDATKGLAGKMTGRGVGGIERVILSFGLNIAVVPLIGLGLSFTPWGIRLVPIMIALSGFTLASTWAAARRRRALPPEERFKVPCREWIAQGRKGVLERDSQTDTALNILLIVSVLMAVSSVAFAVAVPHKGETFTEFYLLTEDESGDLVADDYPTEFVLGDEQEVIVGISNQEHESVDYTVIVELHRVNQQIEPRAAATNTSESGQPRNITVEVIEKEELDRFEIGLEHNETWQQSYEIQPTMTGKEMRLTFLLFRDSPPPNPTVDNAYRETHLWINVSRS